MAFNRDNRSGGGRGFGGRSFNNDRGRDREMFKTTCSNCGRECAVPFKPSGSKPVYCNDCFRTMGGGSDTRRPDDRGPQRPRFDNRSENRDRPAAQPQYREQFEMLNSKLDKILTLLNSGYATKIAKVPDASRQEQTKRNDKPKVFKAPEQIQVPEMSTEDKTAEELVIQPEEQVVVAEKKKKSPKKAESLPVTE